MVEQMIQYYFVYYSVSKTDIYKVEYVTALAPLKFDTTNTASALQYDSLDRVILLDNR